jgi:hypothetical protein
MLTRLIGRADVACESNSDCNAVGEYEHRDVEYVYRGAEYE